MFMERYDSSMNTLYEAQNKSSFPWLILVVGGLICIVLIFIALSHWKHKSIGEKLFIIVPIVVIGIYLAWIYQCLTVPDFYSQYRNGEFQICEGVIEEYRPALVEGDAVDRFSVNGMSFLISDSPLYGYGYPLRQMDGGVLKEGMNVRICYIQYEFQNVIMRIEVES